MKDRKLRVRVSCTNKDFYLEKPVVGADWHIRFTPPRDVRDALGIRERVSRTTGLAELEPAKQMARRIIESYWPDASGNVEALRSVKARDHFATLGEIVARYRDGARSIEDKEDLDPQTITKNVSSLIRIVETRFDEDGRERRAAGTWERLPADRALDPELWNEFKRGWLRAHRDNPSAKRTANSYIRQARSLFGDEYLPLYAGLRLPALAAFRADVKLFKKAGSTRYVPIAQPAIDAMEIEIRGLRPEFCLMKGGDATCAQRTLNTSTTKSHSQQQHIPSESDDSSKNKSASEAASNVQSVGAARPDLYLGFYFMLWLGMRVEEVCEARLEWLESWPEQTRMNICRRPYYKPKGIDGSVSVAPVLVADIRELSGAREPMDYLIPAENPTARRNAIGRELSAVIRRHIGDERQKTCHELRKHAVSMVLMRTRNYVDTLKFSRHADVRTLQEHYAGFLDSLPPIASSNWRAA